MVPAQDLTIATGASVTVESGAYIYSEGNLTNAGTLTLSSNADGYSQLKVDGTVTNTGTISQYLNNDGFTSMSSPMSTDFATTSGDNTWIQKCSDIDGEYAGDLFGISNAISSDGTIIAVGAINNDGNGSGAGNVQVYNNLNGGI